MSGARVTNILVCDTPVQVGVMKPAGKAAPIAMYAIDYGEDHPSALMMMRRYKRISLDTQPTVNGVTFSVASNRVVAEVTSEALDRAMKETSPDGIMGELLRDVVPEFSSCVEMSREVHDRFIAARYARGGYWALLILAEDVTLMLMNGVDEVVSISARPRSDYVQGE